MEIVWDVIISVLTSAAVTGLATLTLKEAIKHKMAKDLAKYKNDLKSSADVEMARVKSDLTIEVFREQAKITTLQEKRAAVIAETFKLMQKAHRSLASYISIFDAAGEPDKQEKSKISWASLVALWEYHEPNQIYFTEALANRISDLLKEMRGIHSEFTRGLRNELRGHTPGKVDTERGEDYWEKAEKRLAERIMPLLAELRKEFRQLIGVEPIAELQQPAQPH